MCDVTREDTKTGKTKNKETDTERNGGRSTKKIDRFDRLDRLNQADQNTVD